MTTKQEFFDKTVALLIKQGEASYDNECLYRGPNNTKCAIGHWIPSAEWEENPSDGALVSSDIQSNLWPTIAKLQEDVGLDFLTEMQDAHDIPAGDENWLGAFKSLAIIVAGNHNLNPEAAR